MVYVKMEEDVVEGMRVGWVPVKGDNYGKIKYN